MNDAERRQWVDNDEGLHRQWKAARVGQCAWVKANRPMIDEYIGLVVSGQRKPHFAAYPEHR